MTTYTDLNALEDAMEQAQIRQHLADIGYSESAIDSTMPTARGTATVRTHVETYSDEWQQQRQNVLGASEIAPICDLDQSSGKDVDQILVVKLAEQVPGVSLEINSRAWWGHQVESSIAQAALYLIGKTNASIWKGTSWIDHRSRLMASPDVVILSQECDSLDLVPNIPTELIECKMVGRSNARKWRDGPPLGFILQLHAQMSVIGPLCSKGYIAALIEGDPVKVWEIDRNDALCTAISEISSQWWEEYVKNRVSRFRWEEYVSERLAQAGFRTDHTASVVSPQTRVVFSPDDLMTVHQWIHTKSTCRETEAAKRNLDIQIVELLGDADILTDPDGRVLVERAWIKKMSLDSKTLILDHPDLEEKYSYPLTYARMSPGKGV